MLPWLIGKFSQLLIAPKLLPFAARFELIIYLISLGVFTLLAELGI